MKLALCNEVLLPMTLAEQCAFAREIGYDGLEIAPFTLADDPAALDAAAIKEIRDTVESHGLVVSSLHWLAMAPKGMSITALDTETAEFTRKSMLKIVELGAGLGAGVLVLGSPAQRRLDEDPEKQRAIAIEHIAAIAEHAEHRGIYCCLEAINANECNFINRIEQAEEITRQVGSPALVPMIDVSHAAQEESRPLAELAETLHANGRLVHLQLNAINRRGPGQSNDPQGRDDIVPLIKMLVERDFKGTIAMEPFEYVPDGPAAAARAVGYVRGVMDAANAKQN